MPKPRIPLVDRFWPKVVKSPDGCWDWLGHKNERGYGIISMGGDRGKLERAHRVSWMLHFGDIPPGMCVLHRCDNPACARPDHLFLGTIADNNRDMREKRRHSFGERHGHSLRSRPIEQRAGRAVLSVSQVRQVRELAATGMRRADIAARFGVSLNTVYRIHNRTIWRYV